MIFHRFEITEEEFKENTQRLRLVNDPAEDGEAIWAMGPSDDRKFIECNEGYFFDTLQPKELECVPCGIKIKTEDHQEKCPICGTSNYDIMDRNRNFEIEFREYEALASRALEDRLRVVQPIVMFKNNLWSKDFCVNKFREAHKAYIENLNKMDKFAEYLQADADKKFIV